MQDAKVAQVMLDSGNQKLRDAMKLLDGIRGCEEKLQVKLSEAVCAGVFTWQ